MLTDKPILNISQIERYKKEMYLTDFADCFLSNRGFRVERQFTIHRTFEYRLTPDTKLKEAIESNFDYNEKCAEGGIFNTSVSLRNSYEHRLDVLGIGYGMELVGIEIKSCWEDFRSDKKWPSYMDFVNRMYVLADEPTAVKIAAYLKDPNQYIKDGLGKWCDFILHCRPKSRMSFAAPANPICAGVIAAMDDGSMKIIKKATRLPADGNTRKNVTAFIESSFGAFSECDLAGTIRASGGSNGGGSETLILDISHRGDVVREYENTSPTLTARMGTGGNNVPCLLERSVRKLMPIECERLQGFPDDWTRISHKGKSKEFCPDGPRYKAVGNSWASNC